MAYYYLITIIYFQCIIVIFNWLAKRWPFKECLLCSLDYKTGVELVRKLAADCVTVWVFTLCGCSRYGFEIQSLMCAFLHLKWLLAASYLWDDQIRICNNYGVILVNTNCVTWSGVMIHIECVLVDWWLGDTWKLQAVESLFV